MIVPHFILGCGVVSILNIFILAFVCIAFGIVWRRISSRPLYKKIRITQEIKLAFLPPKFKFQQAHPPFSLRINF